MGGTLLIASGFSRIPGSPRLGRVPVRSGARGKHSRHEGIGIDGSKRVGGTTRSRHRKLGRGSLGCGSLPRYDATLERLGTPREGKAPARRSTLRLPGRVVIRRLQPEAVTQRGPPRLSAGASGVLPEDRALLRCASHHLVQPHPLRPAGPAVRLYPGWADPRIEAGEHLAAPRNAHRPQDCASVLRAGPRPFAQPYIPRCPSSCAGAGPPVGYRPARPSAEMRPAADALRTPWLI